MTLDSQAYVDRLGADPAWVRVSQASGFRHFLTSEDGFQTAFDDRGGRRLSGKQCGIYAWIAANGEAYVGQSVNIRSRLQSHYKRHRDIRHAAFQVCDPAELDAKEKQSVSVFEKAFPMRNVLLVKESAAFRPLDDALTSVQQARFVENGNDPTWFETQRQEFPVLAMRERPKVASLTKDNLLEIVQTAVTFFADACLPAPSLTEHRFWSVTGFERGDMLARVNAGVQEVFTVHSRDGDFYLRIIGPGKYARDAQRTRYSTGAMVSFLSWEKCTKLFESPKTLKSLRSQMLQLMRLTTPLNSRSHCPGLFLPSLIRAERETSGGSGYA